jgi:hypothetical protein
MKRRNPIEHSPQPRPTTATHASTTTERSSMATIVLIVSLAINGFLTGLIVSHLHYWQRCPVCHDCQYCECDCHETGCKQCH